MNTKDTDNSIWIVIIFYIGFLQKHTDQHFAHVPKMSAYLDFIHNLPDYHIYHNCWALHSYLCPGLQIRYSELKLQRCTLHTTKSRAILVSVCLTIRSFSVIYNLFSAINSFNLDFLAVLLLKSLICFQ